MEINKSEAKKMKTKLTFKQWKESLDNEQVNYILEDFFVTHPDFNPKTKRIEEIYS